MDEVHEIQRTVSKRNRVLRLLRYIPYGKNRGAAHFAAGGLPMGIVPCKLGCPLPNMETVGSSVVSSVGSPLLPNMTKMGSSVGNGVGCQWNFALQIRLPTTSIYGNSWQLSEQGSGLPMGISPCKLGCPLLLKEIKKRRGDKCDRSMTRGKLLDNNPTLFIFYFYSNDDPTD